ncbi:PREDICTED: uncharacterized protein LOC109349414 isoform X2 [Lupinus angustifolius]|uniref:uncharacterized protein LOC109349414 isoform X2 n=2 Tax=Lupinus angustifolius TaxID=3871 RepID=UPI00092E8376|nr:PREDICTED: uncharacterized protein LOC109349414 isoform X2 [Lupinus angustifolius]
MAHCDKSIVKVEPFLNEQINTAKVFEDMEVDIVSWTNKGDLAVNKNEDPDATENSSSFADTTSDTENCYRLSDAEVESELIGDNDSSCTIGAFGSAFQISKKKLTDHWRNFIRPLMWHCRWTELRIKEMESQALKYSKELAEYDKGKHMEPDLYTLEEFGSKSLPFSSDQYRSKAKKRRKRNKVEDTTDVASYASHHNLFSYLENKKSDPDGCLADDSSNPVITEVHADPTQGFGITDDQYDQYFSEFGDADASLEQLLWAIDNVHARIHNLKNHMNEIMSKNASKFSSSENLSLLLPHGDVQTSSAHSPIISAENGDAVSVGATYNSNQHVADFDLGDFVMPGSAVSSYGEVIIVPDIIESTVGLLSSVDVTLHPPQAGDLCENMVDNILIHEVAEMKEHTLISATHYPDEKLQDIVKSEAEENLHPAFNSMSDFDVAANSSTVSREQSNLEPYLYKDANILMNKRKRGERKAGSGAWSKKCSGEPDSQSSHIPHVGVGLT